MEFSICRWYWSVIASLMFMKKIGDLTAERSNVKSLKEESWADEIDFPENLKEKVFIKHIKGPLFFGSTSEFSDFPNIFLNLQKP